MLRKPSPNVEDCLKHAGDCELEADRATDPAAKKSFLDIAARWRRMAESYEHIERTQHFLAKDKNLGGE